MVRQRRFMLSFLLAVAISPALIVSPAGAAAFDPIKSLLNMLNDVFKSIDPNAMMLILDKRAALPGQILEHNRKNSPALNHESEEMAAAVKAHFVRTGEDKIPFWPSTEELLSILTPMVDASYNGPFQRAVANAYGTYLGKLTEVQKAVVPPEDGSAFTASIETVRSAQSYFRTEADKIRAAAKNLKSYRVNGASSAEELLKNLQNAQSQIGTGSTGHPIGDAALAGMRAGLGTLIEIAKLMNERYDYFNQELVDGIVALANSYLETNGATGMNDVAAFTDTIASSLDSIASSAPSEDATTAINDLIASVAVRKADAESKAGGQGSSNAAAIGYYFNHLRDTHRYCYHEDKTSAMLLPMYSMVDELDNLKKPEVILASLNNQLWEALKDAIIPAQMEVDQAAINRVNIFSTNAANKYKSPGGGGPDPIPGPPHYRYTGECGVYVLDPKSKGAAATVSSAALNSQTLSYAKKVSREIKRRKKASKTGVCAPTNLKCIKKAKQEAQRAKQLAKVKTGVSRQSKKFKKELPKFLNNAHFKLYGEFPVHPYK